MYMRQQNAQAVFVVVTCSGSVFLTFLCEPLKTNAQKDPHEYYDPYSY